MNKLLTKIVGAALGLSMAVGVGVAVANNKNISKVEASTELSVSVDYSDFGYTATAYSEATEDNTGFSLYCDLGAKNSNRLAIKQSGILYNNTAFSGKIKNIVIDVDAFSSTSNAGFYVYGSSSKNTETTQILNNDSTTGKRTADFTSYDYKYFKFKNKSNRPVYINSITITYIVPTLVSSLTLDNTTMDILSSDTSAKTITATINSTADNKALHVAQAGNGLTLGGLDANGDITANSSGVATFTIAGKAAISGTETVTVTTKDGSSLSATLVVSFKNADAASITFDKTSASGYRGQTITITATPHNFTPVNYVWGTDKPSRAQLGDSDEDMVEGTNVMVVTIKGDSATTATISCYAIDGEDETTDIVNCLITITASTHSLSILPSTAQVLEKGGTLDVTPTITSTGAYTTNIVNVVSSDNSIISLPSSTVNSGSSIRLTAEGTGTATVTFSANGDSSVLSISVVNAEKTNLYGKYELVTSTAQLTQNSHFLLVSGTDGSVVAASNGNNTNNRQTSSVSVSNSRFQITSSSNVLVLKLEGSEGAWRFKTKNYKNSSGTIASADQGYLMNDGDKKLKVVANGGTFTISIDNTNHNAVITATDGNTQIIRYNDNNTSIFNCYSSGQKDIYLFRQIPDKTIVSEFVTTNMHMSDYDKNGSIGSTGGNGSCTTYYATASAAYALLDEEQQLVFATDGDFTAAKARFSEWARINGGTFDSETGAFSPSRSITIVDGLNSTNIITIIIITSVISLASVGGYFLLRRRKER